jgi:hypothetical protein
MIAPIVFAECCLACQWSFAWPIDSACGVSRRLQTSGARRGMREASKSIICLDCGLVDGDGLGRCGIPER